MTVRCAGIILGIALLPVGCLGNDPCVEDPLQRVRAEVLNYAMDAVERVHDVMEPRADNSGDRFILLMARDIVDAFLHLLEAFYTQMCLLSGCAACALEVGLAAVGEGRASTMAEPYRQMDDRLVIFTELFDSAVVMAEEEEERRRSPSPLPGKRDTVANIRSDLATVRQEGLAYKLDRVFARAAVAAHSGQALGEGADRQLMEASMLGQNFVATLHAQLALEGRHLPGLQGGWGLGPYFKYLNHDSTARLELIALLRGERHAAWPFARSSALCSRPELHAPIADQPHHDASGTFSWNGAPAYDLLKIIERSGRPLSYTYWTVRTATQFGKEIPCEAAVGLLFDPARCLDEQGWGGSVYFVNPDPQPREKERLYVQWRPRAWKSERSLENPLWKAYLDPITPPSEPMDILSLSPLAGNCELLRTLVTADSMTMARLVYAPINPVLPPPIQAEPNFTKFWVDHRNWSRVLHKAGTLDGARLLESGQRYFLAQCSLESTYRMLKPIGYELLHVEYFFAVFAHESVAKLLHRHRPPYAKAVLGNLPASASKAPTPFEAWRRGWYCAPLSRYILDLEARASFDPVWLSPQGASGSPSFCRFLRNFAWLNETTLSATYTCEAAAGDHHEGSLPTARHGDATNGIEAVVRERLRTVWAQDVAHPVAKIAPVMPYADRAQRWGDQRQSSCSLPGAHGCICLPPFRGPACSAKDEVDAGVARPFSAAIAYVLDRGATCADGAYVPMLALALQSLWSNFNARHDYPVLVFYTDMDQATRESVVLASPNRVWFYRIANDERAGASSNAILRFKSSLLFQHPAVAAIDFLWLLDPGIRFQSEVAEDPFLALHGSPSASLAYRAAVPVVEGVSRQTKIWELMKLFLMSRGVHWKGVVREVRERRGGSHFFDGILAAENLGSRWNHQVLAMDSELFRVAAMSGKDSHYAEYVSFLETHLGPSAWLAYTSSAVHTLGMLAASLLGHASGKALDVVELATMPYALHDCRAEASSERSW